MWKALLILFITTDAVPMSMMIGEFPEAFVSQSDCQEFVATKRGNVDDTVRLMSGDGKDQYQVINHELSCIQDPTGQPT